MGNGLKCQLGESEEEIIERIFHSLPFKDIDANKLINDLNKRIIESERLSAYTTRVQVKHIPKISMSFDMEEIQKYLKDQIESSNNPYKDIQLKYFNNIIKMDNSVLILTTILICICKGEKDQKVKILSDLYDKSNLLIDKDLFKFYLKDIIDANSTILVSSFNELFGKDSNRLDDEYNDFRKKKLCEFILSNYTIAFNNVFKDNKFEMTDSIVIGDEMNKLFIAELFDLILPSLKGDFIRNWLAEEYEKDRSTIGNAACCGSGSY